MIVDTETIQAIAILFGVAGTAMIFLSRKFGGKLVLIMGTILAIQSGLLYFLGPRFLG